MACWRTTIAPNAAVQIPKIARVSFEQTNEASYHSSRRLQMIRLRTSKGLESLYLKMPGRKDGTILTDDRIAGHTTSESPEAVFKVQIKGMTPAEIARHAVEA